MIIDMRNPFTMQGCKHFEPRLFYQISLDDLVPRNHLVRRLAEALDLSWIRSATALRYSGTGRPSIDPEVVAKLLLLGYLYNVGSERQLMREVQVNLAYRWYVGYDLDEAIPNHSILSKARRRLGEGFFEQLFTFALGRCQEVGLVKGETVLMDSTIVAANASLDSLTTLRYRPSGYWAHLEDQADPQADSEDSASPLGQRRPRKSRTSDRTYSRTDPDASLYHRRGQGSKLAYKTHFLADGDDGVITSVATSSAAVDDTSVVPALLARHERCCGPPGRAVADHLYGSQDCLGYLQDRGIETVIGPRQGGNAHRGFDKRAFLYDPEQDLYRCPAGQSLRRRRTQRSNGKAFYSCDRGVCGRCELREPCLSSVDPAAVRQVTRFDTPYVERAQAVCASRQGRRWLTKRQTCMEGLFGRAKSQHGLDRARLRGLSKMHIQGLLTAMVLNVKKLLQVVGRGRGAVLRARFEALGDFWGVGALMFIRSAEVRPLLLTMRVEFPQVI
jgi:transposase